MDTSTPDLLVFAVDLRNLTDAEFRLIELWMYRFHEPLWPLIRIEWYRRLGFKIEDIPNINKIPERIRAVYESSHHVSKT